MLKDWIVIEETLSWCSVLGGSKFIIEETLSWCSVLGGSKFIIEETLSWCNVLGGSKFIIEEPCLDAVFSEDLSLELQTVFKYYLQVWLERDLLNLQVTM